MAKTRAQKNKEIRQDALRAQLAEQCRVQHILETISKIYELDPSDEHFSNNLNKLKTANDQRFKLLAKYLPDLKQQEIQLSGQLDFAQVSDECSEEDWENEYGE